MEQQEYKYKVVGTRPIRHDGVDKVTGRAKYGADIALAGMLHAKVLRSPHAHARIKSINTSKALALPGVKAVITGKDLPELPAGSVQMGEIPLNPQHLSLNVMAKEKVLYDGHAVAAVAATSPHIAEEALKLIEVEYEMLPHLLDVREAMKENAPILHADLRTGGAAEKSDKPTNVANHTRFALGDIEKGFAEADVIVEHEFDTSMVHQGYIEPHNAVAQYNPDGHATVWCSTQGSFMVREYCSLLLKIPSGNIKAIPAEIGGGFGGKTTVYLEPLALCLSQKTGKPVKMVMSRAEVLRATGPTSGSHIRVKMGAKKDGTITAAEAWLAYEAGGFPGSPVMIAGICIFSPYSIENMLVDGFDVVLNKPKSCAYRAPGATNASFGSETVIDELAEKLGIDPLEIRRINAAKEGTKQVHGGPYGRIGCLETVEAAKNSPHYQSPLQGNGKPRGRGVASGYWINVGFQSSATVSINTDGTVNIVTGSPDIGGTRASCAMIAAEVLGLKAEEVHPVVADTESIGYTDVTGGSRVTYSTGYAVYEAAMDVIRQSKERAATLWKVKSEEVVFQDGTLSSTNGEAKSMTLKELAPNLARTGGPITAKATVNPRGAGPTFATHIADVEVDPETGKVDILRYTALQDAGKAIHPSYVEGQMQGGVSQGAGWALNEEYVYDENGRLQNAGFLDYRMPTCLDLPMIETIIVEVPNPGHPFGIRGVGEVPIVPPPAAIANAIYRAVGVRMHQLPMSPPRLTKAILEKK